ncbi:hypothetical protein Tco_1389385 [Tanacetum coccineum]
MERKVDEWSKSQNVSSEQTDRTEPPPPPQAQIEHVNAVFTGSGKSDDSPKIQKDPPLPIIVNNKTEKDKPIKTSKKGYHMVKTNEYPYREYIPKIPYPQAFKVDWKWIFKKRSKKKAKNKQIQAREGKDQVKSKSKVIRIQGLKLPSLKLYYKRLKRQGPKLPTRQRLQLSYKTSGDQTAYSPKKSSFPPNKPSVKLLNLIVLYSQITLKYTTAYVMDDKPVLDGLMDSH